MKYYDILPLNGLISKRNCKEKEGIKSAVRALIKNIHDEAYQWVFKPIDVTRWGIGGKRSKNPPFEYHITGGTSFQCYCICKQLGLHSIRCCIDTTFADDGPDRGNPFPRKWRTNLGKNSTIKPENPDGKSPIHRSRSNITGFRSSQDLSIVVSVKNRGGRRVDFFLQSLAIQTDKDFELIMVDYGSNKRFQSELVDFAKKYNFRYFYVDEKDWNRPRALNIGIGKAWGRFVMTTDIDMLFKNTFVASLKKLMAPNRFIYAPNVRRADRAVAEKLLKNPSAYDGVIRKNQSLAGRCSGAVNCAEKKWFMEINGYDERMSGYGPSDWDIWERAKKSGLRTIPMRGIPCAHQTHATSSSFRYRRPEQKEKYRKMVGDKIRKENQKIVDDKPLVTIVLPVVWKVSVAKKTIEALQKHANFPHILKVIINPELTNLIQWAKNRNIIVIPKFYFPIVRAKDESVKLCNTKYLCMFDDDMVLNENLKPMLDLMEAHPEIGICATAISGIRHKRLHHGCNMDTKRKRLYIKPAKRTLPYGYCDYVHHAGTIFRMEVFDDIQYDLGYRGQGWEHEDLFMQLYKLNKWKIVSYNAITVTPIPKKGRPPRKYQGLRSKGVYENLERFAEKWNLKEGAYIKR